MNNSHQILIEAKNEYTKQLTKLLTKSMYEGIDSVYKFSIKEPSSQILKKFQEHLSNIPKWNKTMIKDEYLRILNKVECDWVEELITAVFVSHTKVLTVIKNSEKNNKSIDLKIPCGEHFIHKCYIECARQFWKRPYLLDHRINNIDKQRNINESENLISISIEETIRNMLPVRTILKQYLGKDYQDDIDDDDLSQNIPKTHKDNIKKMVQKEIEMSLNNFENKNDNNINDNYSNYKLDTASIISYKLENLNEKENINLDETKSKNSIVVVEDIKSKNSIEIVEDIKSKNSIEIIEDIKSKNSIEIVEDINSKNSIEIVEDIKSKNSIEIVEDIKSKNSIEIVEDIKSKNSIEIVEDIKSKNSIEIVEDIKSKNSIEIVEESIRNKKKNKNKNVEVINNKNSKYIYLENENINDNSKSIYLENENTENNSKNIKNDLDSEDINFSNSILELEKELSEISSNSKLTKSPKILANDNLFDDAIYFKNE